MQEPLDHSSLSLGQLWNRDFLDEREKRILEEAEAVKAKKNLLSALKNYIDNLFVRTSSSASELPDFQSLLDLVTEKTQVATAEFKNRLEALDSKIQSKIADDLSEEIVIEIMRKIFEVPNDARKRLELSNIDHIQNLIRTCFNQAHSEAMQELDKKRATEGWHANIIAKIEQANSADAMQQIFAESNLEKPLLRDIEEKRLDLSSGVITLAQFKALVKTAISKYYQGYPIKIGDGVRFIFSFKKGEQSNLLVDVAGLPIRRETVSRILAPMGYEQVSGDISGKEEALSMSQKPQQEPSAKETSPKEKEPHRGLPATIT